MGTGQSISGSVFWWFLMNLQFSQSGIAMATALRHLVLFLFQFHLKDSVSKIQQRFPAKAEPYVPTKSLINTTNQLSELPLHVDSCGIKLSAMPFFLCAFFVWFGPCLWLCWTHLYNYRRKFRSESSDNMDRWKAQPGSSSGIEKVRREKMQLREKVGKSRNTVFFQCFVAPEGRKVCSLKRRVRSQLARWNMEKLHAFVTRSIFWSKKRKSTSLSEHFWKLRCGESARRCGAKHIWKWKVRKDTILGALLEVEMLKKCMPFWREAHFEVKCVKNQGFQAYFDVSAT